MLWASFSSRDAITISFPCGACEASSAHWPVLGVVSAVLSEESCAPGITEEMLSCPDCRTYSGDHPLPREERGKLSACTWSSQIVTKQTEAGACFSGQAHIAIWFLYQHSCLASPCSGDYENPLQGCLRSDATFISALLFEMQNNISSQWWHCLTRSVIQEKKEQAAAQTNSRTIFKQYANSKISWEK